MKTTIISILTLGILAVGGARLAAADPINGMISLVGGDTYTNTAVTFNGPSSVEPGTASGTLALFDSATSPAVVTMSNFSFNPFTAGTQIFKVVEGSDTLQFMLNSISTVSFIGSTLVIEGLGTMMETGYDNTNSSFALTTQGGTDTNVSFSATAIAPTSEPSTLFLLGTGLVGCATLLYRRRQKRNILQPTQQLA